MYKAYVEREDIERLENNAVAYDRSKGCFVPCLRDRLLIRLIYMSGMRVSEALNLRVEDINFSDGVVTIKHLKSRVRMVCPQCEARLSRQSVYCSRCGVKVDEPLKRDQEVHRMRTIPLDTTTLQMLYDFISRDHTNGYIFNISRGQAWKIIKTAAERAGLPKLVNPSTGVVHNVSPHRLRDAFAISWVKTDDSGDSLRMLQEQLGHASIATTMRYRKVAGTELKEWYRRIMENVSAGTS